jgi:cellobiose-specific phosphotransferase system component IIB
MLVVSVGALMLMLACSSTVSAMMLVASMTRAAADAATGRVRTLST